MARISVVIPTFNRAELLDKCIKSVIAQTAQDIEIIVCDNNSTDKTKKVVEAYLDDCRVRYFKNETNIGMVGNWKRGIYEHSTSEWFMLMSDDDHLTFDGYLAEAIDAIDQFSPSFIYAGGLVEDVLAGTEKVVSLPFDGLVSGEEVLKKRGSVHPQDAILCNMIFPRMAAKRLGFLDDPFNLSCDSELYLKLCCEGTVYAINKAVCVYLKHGSNLVDTIKSTRELLDHNLDHLLGPYAYACQLNLRDSAEAFRVDSKIDDAVESALLRLFVNDPAWYRACRDRIWVLAPNVVENVENKVTFKTKKLLASIFRKLIIKRYFVTPLTKAT